MSESVDEIVVSARFAALPQLLGCLNRQVESAGIGSACQLRMQLVVEELFANTIHHGHGGECDASVRLSVSCDGDGCRLHYHDSAPAFDPLQAETQPPSPGRLGGAGLHLLRRLIDSGTYRRTETGNLLQLNFKDS